MEKHGREQKQIRASPYLALMGHWPAGQGQSSPRTGELQDVKYLVAESWCSCSNQDRFVFICCEQGCGLLPGGGGRGSGHVRLCPWSLSSCSMLCRGQQLRS